MPQAVGAGLASDWPRCRQPGGHAVGFGEGVTAGAKSPFDNTTRIVRRWRTETTPDGRTIQVPEDIVVDAQGRPVGNQPRK